MSHGTRISLLIVFASLFLVGTQCTVVGSSGGGSSSHSRSEVRASSGHFSGCSHSCLRFSTGSKHKFTGSEGEYSFDSGAHIRFFIGDLQLGEKVHARSSMTPVDLFDGGSVETPTVINLTRLLLSLDATPDDVQVTIPRKVHRTVVLSNADVAHSIRSMNFGDDAAFLNAASQILSTCADAYAFTPTLADQEAARRWLRKLP